MSLRSRYLGGEVDPVWGEIRRGGIPDGEIELVALETARRARTQVNAIIAGFREAGFRPAFDAAPRTPPPEDVHERIARVESRLGPLPAMLRASVIEIGAVCLSGDCPELGLTYHDPHPVTTPAPGSVYPDPLWLPGIDALDSEADPVIGGIHGRPGITYLEYLRAAVAWGGLPGFEFGEPPARLDRIRREPAF